MIEVRKKLSHRTDSATEIVQRIFTEYVGGLGYKKIAHILNGERVPSPRDGSWDISGVRTILFNENYRGHRVWNQTRRNKKLQRGTKVPKPREEWVITENAHPAIVAAELWKQAQKRRGEFQVPIGVGSAGGNNIGRSTYLLTGLLKCAECGANYIMSKRKSKGRFYGYYRCSWHSNRGKNVCGNKRMLSQKKAEEAVLNVIADELLTVETIENIVEEARGLGRETPLETAERLKLVEADLKLVEKEIANLVEAIKMTGPLEELVRELPPLRSRKSALKEEQRDVKRQAQTVAMEGLDAAFVVEVISNLKETIHRVTAVEQKVLLLEFVAEIRVPQTGEALLMVDPVGLSRLLCLNLVTPRGHTQVANTFGEIYFLRNDRFVYHGPAVA